jgi:hypothetical protein
MFMANAHEGAAAAQNRVKWPDKQIIPRLNHGPDVGQKQSALQKQPIVLALVIGDEDQPFPRPVLLQYTFQAHHLYVAEAAPEQKMLADVRDGIESSLVPGVVEKTEKCPFRWFSHGPLSGQKVYCLRGSMATCRV